MSFMNALSLSESAPRIGRRKTERILAALDEDCREDLTRTERLLMQLLVTGPNEEAHKKWRRRKRKLSKEKPRETIPFPTKRELWEEFGEVQEELL